MSHTSKFKEWYKEKCGHPLGVNLGMKAVNELTEENAKLREQLKHSHEWLGINNGYHGSPLCVNNEKLLNQLKDKNNDK